MTEKVKFLCWDDEDGEEEDGEVLEGYDPQDVAVDFAEKLYNSYGPDWNAKRTTLMLKNMTTEKRYKFEVNTEYEPIFYAHLKEDEVPAVATE